MLEKDLDIYDVWESPNGNLFLKLTDTHSLALGPKGGHEPHDFDLKISQYIKTNQVTPVKRVGRIVFDIDVVADQEKLFELLTYLGFVRSVFSNYIVFRNGDELLTLPNAPLSDHHYFTTRKQLDMNGHLSESEFNQMFNLFI